MVRSLGTSLSAALVACALASPAIAKPFTYTNARFGTSVTFPDDVFTGQAEPPENGDGMTFLAEDGASLAVYGSNNALCSRAATATRFSIIASNSGAAGSSTRFCSNIPPPPGRSTTPWSLPSHPASKDPESSLVHAFAVAVLHAGA